MEPAPLTRKPLCFANVGLAEIQPFEQERFTPGLRQRIGEAVAEVQLCRMPSLAEIKERLPG
jgi:hypothetical protein